MDWRGADDDDAPHARGAHRRDDGARAVADPLVGDR
jgi:hypothetical protein